MDLVSSGVYFRHSLNASAVVNNSSTDWVSFKVISCFTVMVQGGEVTFADDTFAYRMYCMPRKRT